MATAPKAKAPTAKAPSATAPTAAARPVLTWVWEVSRRVGLISFFILSVKHNRSPCTSQKPIFLPRCSRFGAKPSPGFQGSTYGITKFTKINGIFDGREGYGQHDD
jgi:hypothetical protein